MSFVGKNIKKIRTVKKLSQADFAKLFDLARPSIGAYEEGRAEPKIETIITIAKKYGLSIDLLLTKELTINELFNFDIFKKDLKDHPHEAEPASPSPGVPLVTTLNSVEYLVKHKNQDFINGLPSFWTQKKIGNQVRAFEVNGTEMEFYQNGLHHGDVVLAKRIDPPSSKSIGKNRVYVVVGPDRIQVRRLVAKGNGWTFSADNPNYQDIQLEPSKILEIWEAIGVYSTYLNPPEMIERRLMELEQQFESFRQQKHNDKKR